MCQLNKFVSSISEYDLSLLKILGMVVIGVSGTVASGTSTNGAIHKIPGLVSLILQKSSFPCLVSYVKLVIGA